MQLSRRLGKPGSITTYSRTLHCERNPPFSYKFATHFKSRRQTHLVPFHEQLFSNLYCWLEAYVKAELLWYKTGQRLFQGVLQRLEHKEFLLLWLDRTGLQGELANSSVLRGCMRKLIFPDSSATIIKWPSLDVVVCLDTADLLPKRKTFRRLSKWSPSW